MEGSIRNVALLSHSGAGKTSLVEAFLYRSGARPAMGTVEEGTTASDSTAEEQRRKISIYTSVQPVSWKGARFNLLDTPGYSDFVGEIRGAQVAADAAMILVSAVSGVAVGTERVWRSSRERELSTLFVINKMDRDNADFFRTMADIEASLAGRVAAVQIPIGAGEDFRGIVDLLAMKAYVWPDGEPREAAIPDEVAGVAEEYRARLVEAIVETDDELMMRYLEDRAIEDEALRRAFFRAVRRDELTPVLLCSATRAVGIGLLLDFMREGVRHVEDHKPLPTVEGEPPALGRDAPFGARIFKTSIDPYLGKISYLRVLSGVLAPGDTIRDTSQGIDLRVSHLFVPNGKDLQEVGELSAGMIGALTKIPEAATGDTLADPGHPFRLAPIRLPSPVMALALVPKSRADDDKLGPALQKLLDEDPTLVLERNGETHETVLWGMGHVHLEVATEKMRERYNVEVETRRPRIPYRETIRGRGDARYRHKKQTGGAGQFAEVALRVEPLGRGEGFEFGNEVVGGAIPGQFVPSCEKGIRGALEEGVLGGFPVVDVRAVIYDGKDHPVDSKDIAFQIAAAHAFREAVTGAQPVLLEPVAFVKVRVPDRFTGEVIGDLNTRRGRILGMENEGSVSVVSAHAPLAELQSYSPELRSMTGGRGAFSLKFDHYAEVPRQLTEGILAEQRAQQKAGAGD
ncbi:MAG TPA: elongation factor G [Trueperaceae bacterium]